MSTHNPDQKSDILDDLLDNETFNHELVMGSEVAAKIIDDYINSLIPEGGGD
tara:strand:+ start:136 stop:291 length:156 start_codon:yes stop_codon:yes gene_type:complete